ncbi:DUF922 domain-containing protein [Plebeiibacterium marinum]|uniref:DUF922 domain-containing Zn-dependent protease n=1 Tax=Plebeiibacterium marinum TaxID=2992111 RepID=A0AAE3SKI7_9BACT|nr:DUF922 domain-containing protein [Plebeiobacterium marinum]MCW3806469.1 DUF922 domain-containing Zn-dependent protease [Plebeiobacterium marinum]
MKYVFIGLVLIGLYLPKENRYKSWNEEEKLTWNDFTFASKDTCSFAKDALISVLIKYKSFYNPKLGFSVVAVIDKKTSWTIDTISKDLLEHEQYHFDLCELYARKIRETYDSLLKTNNTNILKYTEVFERLDEEHFLEQSRYDVETNHGADKSEQKMWETYIEEELMSLNTYADTLVCSNYVKVSYK